MSCCLVSESSGILDHTCSAGCKARCYCHHEVLMMKTENNENGEIFTNVVPAQADIMRTVDNHTFSFAYLGNLFIEQKPFRMHHTWSWSRVPLRCI